MIRRYTLALLVFAACKSDKTSVDAPMQHTDAPRNDAKVYMDAKVFMDAMGGMLCTGLLYDSCNPAMSNCMGATTCRTFTGRGFSICTQACSAQAPCPNQAGQAVTCNGMGVCVPNAPNTGCTAP
jgi:hypothetical protein